MPTFITMLDQSNPSVCSPSLHLGLAQIVKSPRTFGTTEIFLYFVHRQVTLSPKKVIRFPHNFGSVHSSSCDGLHAMVRPWFQSGRLLVTQALSHTSIGASLLCSFVGPDRGLSCILFGQSSPDVDSDSAVLTDTHLEKLLETCMTLRLCSRHLPCVHTHFGILCAHMCSVCAQT